MMRQWLLVSACLLLLAANPSQIHTHIYAYQPVRTSPNTLTLGFAPNPASSVQLYVNGLRQSPQHYTVSAATIRLRFTVLPADEVLVDCTR